MKRCFRRGSRRGFHMLAGAALWMSLGQQPANAVDEIQVYSAGIAAPGQFTIQQHLNYIGIGYKFPVLESNSASERASAAGPVNPMSRSAARLAQP